MIKRLFLAVCFVVGLSAPAVSATYEVANYGDGSMSVANFNSALTAASAGDTILFDGTNATWSETATVGKAVTVNGNGTKLTAGATLSSGFFNITGFTDESNTMRITGFELDLVDHTGRGIYVNSVTLSNLRIDSNTFYFGSVQIEVGGSFGVIDNNVFYNGASAIYYTAGTTAQANASWDSMSAGTSSAMFIEYNIFYLDGDWPGGSHGNGIDTHNGGKLVIRHNEWDYDNWGEATTAYTIQTHGNAAGGLPATQGYWESGDGARRGQSVVEIYSNYMHGTRIDFMATIRGSANLIYNNIHTDETGGTSRIYMYEEEQWGATNWDPLRAEWPAEDQIHNTFIWGNTFDDGTAQSISNIALSDIDASCTGSDSPYPCCTGSGAGTCNEFVVQDRDFFLHRPATTGEGMTLGIETFTSANGAAGTHPTDGDPYTDEGTMEFTADVENAYYGYSPYT